MKKIFFLFVLTTAQLFSQEQLIFDQEYSYHFPFSAETLTDSLSNQTFLKKLALLQNKSPQFLQYNLHGIIQHKIYKIDTTSYKIFLVLKNFDWTGNILYRDMPLAPVLLPTLAKYEILLFSKNDISPSKKIQITQELKNNLGYVELAQKNIPQTAEDINFIKADHFSFFYTEQNIANLEAYKKRINDYYEAKQKLIELDSILNSIDTNNIEKLPFYHIDIKTIEKAIQNIKNQDFFNTLRLWEKDPALFASTLENVEKKFIAISTKIQQKLNNYEILLYNKALAAPADSALKIFKRITLVNPSFSPAYFRLMEIFLQKNNPDSAYYYWEKTSSLIIPDSITRHSSNITEKLYLQLKNKAKSFIEEENFYPALDYLKKDSIICYKQNNFSCKEEVQKYFSQAHYGIYKSFLTIANKALEQKKPSIAYVFLKNAWNYQLAHASYILTNIEIKKFFEQLSLMLNEEIKNSLGNNSIENIEKNVLILDTVCTYYLDKKCNEIEKIKKEIEKKQLFSKLKEIYDLYSKKQFAKANEKYDIILPELLELKTDSEILVLWKKIIPFRNDQLKNWLQSDNFSWNEKRNWLIEQKVYSQIDTFFFNQELFKTASQHVFFEELKKNEKLLSNPDSISTIKNILPYLEKLKVDAGNTEKVHNAWKKFMENYKTQHCLWLATINNNEIDSIKIYISQKNYIKVIAITEKIIRQSELDSCDSEVTRWKKIKFQVETVVQQMDFLEFQQKKLTQTSPAADWNVFFRQYLQTYENIYLSHLDTLGFTLLPLNQWLSEQRLDWIEKAMVFYVDNEYFSFALDLLWELRKKNFPREKTKSWQKLVGEHLAAKDILGGIFDYKRKCIEYTRGDSYFEYFRKAYYRVWKKY
jgi:hypothetical protein